MTIKVTFDQSALDRIDQAFAQSLGDVVEGAAKDAEAIAPRGVTGRYARSISWAAFEGSTLVGGNPGSGPVHFEGEPAVGILFTRSGLGHILELGTAVRATKGSGANRGAIAPRPHLTPAFLSALGRGFDTVAAGMKRRLGL